MTVHPGRRALLKGLTATALAGLSGCGRVPVPPGREEVPFWFCYGGRNREVLLRMVDRFNATQDRVFVRATFQGDYFEALAKLRTAIAAKAAPALSHVVGEVVPYLHAAGTLEALDDYPGAGSLGLVPALAQEGGYVGGKDKPLVALPFNRSTPIMYCNPEMLDKVGREPPKTWDELVDTAQALTTGASGGNAAVWGFECPISWWFWVALTGQAGGKVMSNDGYPLLGGEAGVKAIQLWQRMAHDLRCMRPPPGRDYNAWQVTNGDFIARRAGIIFTSTAFLRYLEDNAPFPVKAAPMPKDKVAAVPTGGTFFVMLKGAPDGTKLAAWEFVRWMMMPEQTIEWATSTGYMPVAREAVTKLEQNGFYAKSPNDRVAMDQLAHAMPWPWAENLFRVQRECVDPRLEEAVLGRRDATLMLDEARKLALEDG